MARRRPQALVRAAKKAEDAHKKAYPEQYETSPADPAVAEDPVGAVDAVDAVELEETPGALTDAPASFEDTPAREPSTDIQPPDYRTLYEQEVQRRRTLEGKYRKEVPAMAFQISELKRKVDAMETRSLETPSTNQPLPSKEPNPKVKKFQEEFPDVYEGVTSVMSDLFEEKEKKFVSDIKKIREETYADAERRFWREMDRDFSQWRKLNKNPEFLAWLDEPEPYSGITKAELIESARKRHDSVKVIQFFEDFLNSKKSTSASTNFRPTEDDLNEQISIPRGSRPPFRPPNNQPVVTRRDLTRFYEDIRRGLWKGRDVEKQKEEQRLVNALRRRAA